MKIFTAPQHTRFILPPFHPTKSIACPAGAVFFFCGGIGTGAQVALMQAGIQMFGGLSGAADTAVADYLAGKLIFNADIHCTHHDHDEGHTCGSHGCGGGCH